jgi:DNA-binding LacI/PurR family transcriptional regulator
VTASVVLNNNEQASTRVSDATRRRVLAAAARLRYQPNAIARSLRDRTTHTICFYSGDRYSEPSHPFVSQIISGLQRACELHRKDLLLLRKYPGQRTDDVYARLASGKLDGIVYYGTATDPLVEQLVESHLAVVALADRVPGVPSVVVDDTHGGACRPSTWLSAATAASTTRRCRARLRRCAPGSTRSAPGRVSSGSRSSSTAGRAAK